MSHILVVETDKLTIERVRDTLGAEGFKVEVVAGHDEAVRTAAELRPRFVIVSGDLPRAHDTVQVFSRARGGPGSVVLLSDPAARGGAEADEQLVRPFTESQLRLLASRLGSASAAARVAGDAGKTLTSREIFGDLLAEVESEEAAARGAATPPAEPAAPAPAPPRPALAAPAAPVLAAPTASTPPRATARPAVAGKDVEDLLSKTLSGLDLTRRSPAKPAAKPIAAPIPASAPAAAAPPASPLAPPMVPSPAPVAEPPSAPGPSIVGVPAPAAPSAPVTPAPAPPEPTPVSPAIAAPIPAPVASPTPAAAKSAERPAKRPTSEIDLAALDELARPKSRAGAPAPKKSAEVFATQRFEVPREAARPMSDAFGDYTLLERIAVGGMAEVWKARKRGVEGFQKTVAIKRILPHLTDSADFVTMFIDEAKLAAQLDHNHIIHIYDLGKAGDDYYIAMEFVEGKDLRSILNTARQKAQPLPMGLAVLIASRLASALDYAHRKKDFDGRELGLVHRDVSPQNVLISHEGEIKLCDFGIVKAVTKASKTQMGALKGKLQYMSPEQAWGRPVDSRSDIFSLGSILFEMLTGRRLFAGESEMSVLESVREGRIQGPRDLDARLPLEINTLVLRALAKEPGERFQSAGEMQRELEKILYAQKPTPAQADLAAYVRHLFDLEPREAGPVPPQASAAPTPSAGPLAPVAPASRPRHEPAASAPVPAIAPLPEADLRESPAGGSRNALWGGLAAAAVIGIALAVYLGRGGTPPAPPTDGANATNATNATEATGAPADAAVSQPEAPAGASEVPATASTPVAAAARPTVAAAPTAAPTLVPTPATRATPVPTATVESVPEPATPEPTPEPTAAPATAPPPTPQPRQEAAPAAPSVMRGDLVNLGPGVSAPVLVSAAKPQYPPIARRLKIQGEVIVSMLVDENGRVVETKMTRPFPQDVGFNEAALATARTATFRPAMKDGVPVKVWFQLKVPFKL